MIRARRLLLALVVMGLPPASSGWAAALQAIPVDLRVFHPPEPVVAEGQRHLIYELHLTNLGAAELVLERLDVLDAARGAVLTTYDGDALAPIVARPGTRDLADARAIGPGLSAVLFIDVIQPTASAAPAVLSHRLTFRPIRPANTASAQSLVSGGRTEVARRAPVVLGPPLRGGGWLASHALSNESSHRRTLIALEGQARIAQRFAVDWTRIGPDGQVFRGDPASNANWTPWGAEVLAVADGTVVERVDGIPENDPTADDKAVPITVDNAAGNHLVLDIGGGRYVMYAHLRPGAFRVGPGQKVRRGQVLASLGNSGKSDAPHLHLQVTDGPSPLASEGLPFVFERFRLEGHLSSLKALVDGTGWRPTGAASVRDRETPVQNAVVGFPDR